MTDSYPGVNLDLSHGCVWRVYGPDGTVWAHVDYEREDVAAQFERFENGDGGLTFEESMDPGYEVTLVSWDQDSDSADSVDAMEAAQ